MAKQETPAHSGVRVDKWLWAARFYKTRSLATDAVEAGHVHLNGQRPKPARELKVGDLLRVHTEHGEFEVNVTALSDKRGPAEAARALYTETPESQEKRERVAEADRLAPRFEHPQVKGRPTKKFRRQMNQFERG